MQQYIGTKLINAKPMTRLAYNELPVPAFRSTNSRKAPMMVSAEALGAWIDKTEAEAKVLWERSQV